jgi:hypothetical protein
MSTDIALSQGTSKRKLIQSRQARSLGKREPVARVKPTPEFDLHMSLALAWLQRQARKSFIIHLKNDPHSTFFQSGGRTATFPLPS